MVRLQKNSRYHQMWGDFLTAGRRKYHGVQYNTCISGLTDRHHSESHILAQVEQLVNVSAQSQHPSAHSTLGSDLLQPMTANKRHLNLKFVL